MTRAVLDDHLLRDHLSGRPRPALASLLRDHDPATTNLYLYRLCRSVAAAAGGALTGSWAPTERQALGEQLVRLPATVAVVPVTELAYRMATLAAQHHLSTLGAEAVAAAEVLQAPLVVWEGDDGPRIRAACAAVGVEYQTLGR